MGRTRVTDLESAKISKSDVTNDEGTKDDSIDGKKRGQNTVKDPREGCCWQGGAFMNALKAMITRQMFLLHAMVVLWRATTVKGELFWLFAIPYMALLAETFIVLLYRRAKEWKWFSFCVFIYLICVVPPIWFLELNKIDRYLEGLQTISGNNTDTGNLNLLSDNIGLSSDQWIWLLEQTMMVIIIIGRWLLPKGELSREQLSSLLLNYLITASDIVDFFSITNESDILKQNKVFVYSVLTLWTWSLMQFPFVTSMQKHDGDDSDDEDDEDDEDPDDQVLFRQIHLKEKPEENKKSLPQRIKRQIHLLLQTEAWVICLTLFLQDFPFLILRLASLIKYQVLTRSNQFFICKNTLTLLLQIYRLYSLYRDHVETLEKKKKQRNQMLMNTMFRWAFVYGKVKNGQHSEKQERGVDYGDAKRIKELHSQFVF